MTFFMNADEAFGVRSFNGLVKFTEKSPNFSLKQQIIIYQIAQQQLISM